MAAPTNPLTWNTYVQSVCTMAVLQTTTVGGVVQGVDAQTNVFLPQALQYAELRIQRDLDLLQARVSRSYGIAPGGVSLAVPVSDFITIESLTVSNAGATTPLLPTTLEFLQNVYGDATVTGRPAYFAMAGGDLATTGATTTNVTLAPAADASYSIAAVGMARMPSLYYFANAANAATGVTWISSYLPDLLIMASLIFTSDFQRNFGATSNDPQMGTSYEQQYGELLAGAKAENARSRFESSAWTSKSQPSNATPNR